MLTRIHLSLNTYIFLFPSHRRRKFRTRDTCPRTPVPNYLFCTKPSRMLVASQRSLSFNFLRKHLRHQSFLLPYKRNAEICTDRFLGDFKVDSPNNNSLNSQIIKIDMQKCCTLFSVFFSDIRCVIKVFPFIKSVT